MATYYVRPTNGNDGNSGTSFANAWQTTAHALANATSANDVVLLCAESTETITTTLATASNGSSGQYILFRGVDGVDGTTPAQYTIQASSSLGGPVLSIAHNYVHFQGITFDCNSNATYGISTGNNAGLTFKECKATGGTSGGIFLSNGNAIQQTYIFDCECYDNTGPGLTGDSINNRGLCQIIGGSFHDNSGDGIAIYDGNTAVIGALVYDNGGHGVSTNANQSDGTTIHYCTIYGNTSSGISIHQHCENWCATNNTIVGNGAYGIAKSGGAVFEEAICDYNHFHDNTSGTYQMTTKHATNDISGDPLFTSTTDGSEDFTPQSSSPLIDEAVHGRDIGAKKGAAAESGGNGGTRVYSS